MHLNGMEMKQIIMGGIAAAAVILLSGNGASAAEPHRDLQPYGYGHVLEIGLGLHGNSFTINGEAKTAHGLALGPGLDYRYTYYAGRHWGFYADFSLYDTYANDRMYFGAINRADGNKYIYDPNYTYDHNEQSLAPVMTVGAAYRYDFGQWSLRPRVGIGVASYNSSQDSYVRYDKNGGNPVFFERAVEIPTIDYIKGHPYHYSSAAFMMQASIQMTYTLRHHFFFYTELGLNEALKRVNYQEYKWQGKSMYDPETWAEAIYTSSYQGQYSPDLKTEVVTDNVRMVGCSPYLRFGFGWHLGWNRNANGWYKHRR